MNNPIQLRIRNTLIAGGMATVLALSGTAVFAHPDGDGGERDPGQRFDYIFTQLDLSETQSEQVLAVMQSFAESKREAMRERHEAGEEKPDREAMAAQREEARQQLADELGTVLQPTQVEELMTYLEFHAKPMGGPKGFGGKRHGHR